MTRHLLAAFASLLVLAVPFRASATDLTSEGGFLFDVMDGLGGASSSDGAIEDGDLDEYDDTYVLFVNGTKYNAPVGSTSTVSARVITMPVMVVGSLRVHRIVYVPAAGGDWVRYVDVVENPTGAPVAATLRIDGDLGSDGATVVTSSSSGDLVVTPADSWFGTDDGAGGDNPLAHVFQSNDPSTRATLATQRSVPGFVNVLISYTFNASVPAGGRVAIMHFGIQGASIADARADAEAILLEPESIYFGLDGIRDDIINWGVRTGPCAGADGTTCTVAGLGAGRCYGGVCCPGCWDGTRCSSGRGATACGVAGGMCDSCSDEDLCTSDVCTAGVCTNPNAPSGTTCDDGAFCTATDRCDGSGSCLGTGSPCNDGASCTTDTCDELAASCMNTMLPGTCTIGGTCVTAGTPNPTNACEVCDATVSATAWTPVSTGTSCGTQRCSGGRFFPAGACSSTGICVVPSARDCPTGMCTGTICEGACTDTSCASGEFCSPTTLMCAPLVVAGGACSLGTNCVSGICTDNVCCESACDGTCERCGSTGVCTRVTSGADPDRECPGDEVCDGAGMCRMPAMMDAGVDAGAIDAGDLDAGSDAGPMDAGPDDAGNDASVDATIMRPDVQIGDAGLPPTPRGCACSTPRRTESGSAPLGLLGLALALGLTVARRRR